MNLTGIDLFAIVLLGYFLLVAPVLARRELAKLRRELARGTPGVRMGLYRRTIVMEWVISAAVLTCWLLMGRSLTEIGLQFTVVGGQWIALAICATATVLFAISTLRAIGNPKTLEQARSQLGVLAGIAPHTTAELRRFNWVSITAGICEEFLYRGLLMTSLAATLGLWPAVLLSSVVFGIGHAYQGAGGILRTGLVGLVMALVVVFTGSLPAAMVMHAVIDLTQGRLLRAAVNSDPSPAPCAPGAAPVSA